MAGTLREELASLKIDRPSSMKAGRNGHSKPVAVAAAAAGCGCFRGFCG